MTSHANLGKPLELLIIRANEVYKERHIAVIEKQPTEWIPLRHPRTHKIVSAKVTRKAIVDFLGRYQGRPIAFDAKLVTETPSQKGDRIRFREIDDNQEKFLNYWTYDGSPGFVLVSFDLKRFFVVTWEYWRTRLEARRDKADRASISIDALEELSREQPFPRSVAEVTQTPTNPLDYLAGVHTLFFDRPLASGQVTW